MLHVGKVDIWLHIYGILNNPSLSQISKNQKKTKKNSILEGSSAIIRHRIMFLMLPGYLLGCREQKIQVARSLYVNRTKLIQPDRRGNLKSCTNDAE